jgi:putative sigma-54 modulation protein
VNIAIKARHMDVTDSVRKYVEDKVAKLPRFYDNIQDIEVILDTQAERSLVEIVAHAKKKHTFVASHRDESMYACLDACLDKISEQLRRHKDKVRDRQGPSHEETTPAS